MGHSLSRTSAEVGKSLDSIHILGVFKAEEGKECKVGKWSSQAGLVEEEETEHPELHVPSQMESTMIPKIRYKGMRSKQSVSRVASHL